jgi:hypothetical protein
VDECKPLPFDGGATGHPVRGRMVRWHGAACTSPAAQRAGGRVDPLAPARRLRLKALQQTNHAEDALASRHGPTVFPRLYLFVPVLNLSRSASEAGTWPS